jgi:inner membrane protein
MPLLWASIARRVWGAPLTGRLGWAHHRLLASRKPDLTATPHRDMDNVSHSLAGLLLAESAIRLRVRRGGVQTSGRFRAVAAIASMLGANLPDADLLYTGSGGNRLYYMLYHRGYTHTVVIAVLGALLLWCAGMLALRWSTRTAPSKQDRRWLLGLLLVSLLSHLVLDWTNSYGVHPFWPIDNRWRYGDAVFIVEPWLWVVSVPALVAASPRWAARVLLSLVLAAGLTLAWRVDLVSPGAALALTIGALLSVLLAVVLRPDSRVAVALGAWILVTLVMAAGAASSRVNTVRAAREADPAAQILDVVVSPLPANPLCAAVITVERIGVTYRIATARVSAAPSIVEPIHCASRDAAGSIIESSTRAPTRAVHWDGEWSAPTWQLEALARESCPARAALRFIRAPIWRAAADSTVILGDARFGGASGNAFTDVRVPLRTAICPLRLPPWTPPRTDLLGVMLATLPWRI